jgi:type I restriction enzyme S subunit
VPEHWEIVPSTWLFVESNERAHADDEHLSATQKYGVIPLAEYERLEGRQVTHAVKNLPLLNFEWVAARIDPSLGPLPEGT